jgi:hypothetical protein
MEYTEQQKQAFRDAFAARRRRQLLVYIPFIVLIIVFTTESKSTGLVLWWIPISIFLPIFIIAFLGVLSFSLINWRCPACKKFFGRAFNLNYCSNCGVRLRQDPASGRRERL